MLEEVCISSQFIVAFDGKTILNNICCLLTVLTKRQNKVKDNHEELNCTDRLGGELLPIHDVTLNSTLFQTPQLHAVIGKDIVL